MKGHCVVQNSIYIDTNIVIDISDAARPLHKNSLLFVRSALEQNKQLYINSDSLSNLFYILSNRTQLDKSMVLEKMRYVMTIFTLVVIEMKDAADAVGLCEDPNAAHRDYEDALQYICAKKINAEMIVTNDKGFISPDIDLLTTQQ